MITLTESAGKKVLGMMETEPNRKYLRVYVEGGGCSGLFYGMAFADEKRESDNSFESAGVPVLVDEKSAPYIEDMIVDWKDDLVDSGFTFDNPSAKASCACGKSFCG